MFAPRSRLGRQHPQRPATQQAPRRAIGVGLDLEPVVALAHQRPRFDLFVEVAVSAVDADACDGSHDP
jgi:hypothetical protein